MSDLWRSLQHSASNLIYNYERTRRYEASLSKRQEGFTEIFGVPSFSREDAEEKAWICGQPYPTDTAIVLIQYRVAIFEQMVLSLAKLPFTVVNTHYACNEATGPYPQLREHHALVGGDKPEFLQYLREHHQMDLDIDLTDVQRRQSQLLMTLVQTELDVALRVCQFGDPKLKKRSTSFWQHWAERCHYYSYRHHDLTVVDARRKARQAYDILQAQLVSNRKHASEGFFSNDTLLGTNKPTTIDCRVVDHVLHAIHTPHLVSVLADFTELVRFAQDMYESHMEAQSREWNLLENSNNHFFQTAPSLSMMQEMASKTMEERVAWAAQSQVAPHQRKPFVAWHRWRRGDTFLPRESPEDQKGNTEQQENIKRQYKRDDELWIGGIAVASLLAFGIGAVRALQVASKQ